MTTPVFSFVPRNLTKKSKVDIGATNTAARTLTKEGFRGTRKQCEPRPGPSSTTHPAHQLSEDEIDLRVLLELSLSDHALWSNEELLQAIEASSEAYIPTRSLVRLSPYFIMYARNSRSNESKAELPSESTFLRCARASDLLECRMIVADPDWSTVRIWMNGDSALGGIEVRRKDWAKVRDHLRRMTAFYWHSRTVYVENLPPNARHFPTIELLVRELLHSHEFESSGFIQSISFPAHRDDPPDAPPPSKSKGFAFIVLTSVKLCDALLDTWPWEYTSSQEQVRDDSGKDNAPKLLSDARDFGIRCMSKKRWEAMKKEYLDLQQKLLQKTVAASTRSSRPRRTPFQIQSGETYAHSQRPLSTPTHGEKEPSSLYTSAAQALMDVDHDYPLDCLVFVKNIHPETNKTTLKALFSAAIGVKADVIDYVDYTKGLDSCHLRLTSPAHARSLSAHFSAKRLAQTDALSHVCEKLTSDLSQPSISVEVIQGRKEEMYWQKVPEKVKRVALAKVAAASDEGNAIAAIGDSGSGTTGQKRKKRPR